MKQQTEPHDRAADRALALRREAEEQAGRLDSAAAGLKALADRYDYGKLDKLLANGGRDNG